MISYPDESPRRFLGYQLIWGLIGEAGNRFL